MRGLNCQFKDLWTLFCRKKERFVLTDCPIGLPRQSGDKRGRKELQFEDLTERSKNKKTLALRRDTPLSLLIHATQLSK